MRTNRKPECVGIVFTLSLVTILATGCGGNAVDTRLEGIYAISGWTLNQSGCGAVGDPVLASQPAAFVAVQLNRTTGALEASLCADEGSCGRDVQSDAWMMKRGDDAQGWEGHQLNFGAIDGDLCAGSLVEISVTREGEDGIRIELHHMEEATFPKTRCFERPDDRYDVEADRCVPGTCSSADARAACANQPCSACEVITASFKSELPVLGIQSVSSPNDDFPRRLK